MGNSNKDFARPVKRIVLKRTVILFFGIALILHSCAIRTIPEKGRDDRPEVQRKGVVAIFMDGTSNKANDSPKLNTHVKTMHGLVDTSVRSLYIEGVGTRKKAIGALQGAGTKARIARAWRFLAAHYKPGDSIILFGFSRGANQCRILSNVIATAGIPDLGKIPSQQAKLRLLKKMYDQYRGYGDDLTTRRQRVSDFVKRWNQRHNKKKIGGDGAAVVEIELMALWETVEAFDVANDDEITTPRADHLNQVQNVKRLIHAVSLDDNRAWTYTPILVSTTDVAVNADTDKKGVVEEVWFSGSHRDVGGGNRKEPYLQNVTLKWMLDRVRPYGLFRDSTVVADVYAKAHNMNEGALRLAFADNNRSIVSYHQKIRPSYSNGRLKVHRSVIDRLAAGVLPYFKTTKNREDWFDQAPFKYCFEKKDSARILKPNCGCIEVVE